MRLRANVLKKKHFLLFLLSIWSYSVVLLMKMVHDRCSTLLTEFSTALTTILPILFQYCYKYCYSDSRTFEPYWKREVWRLKFWFNPPFLGNACTKSGSLRFSQFSGCWLILSVYILLSFDFPFGRLFGVR